MSKGSSSSHIQSNKRWRENNKELFKKRAREYQQKRRDDGLVKKYNKLELEKETCEIIKKHHENMKDDPESLSTEFIQNIIGRKCDD